MGLRIMRLHALRTLSGSRPGELSREGKLGAAEPMRRAEMVLNEVQQSIGNTLAVASLLMGGGRVEGVDTDIDALIEVAIADMPPGEAWRVRMLRETGTRTATMDPGLMRLALRNLLANALEFSPDGGTIHLALTAGPRSVSLSVRDHGPGVAPEKPLGLPMAGVLVHATRDGPIVVKGGVTLQHPEGKQEQRRGSVALCRCGQTRSTPFCDGTHTKVGFRSPA